MSTENVELSVYETEHGKASVIQSLIDQRWKSLIEHDRAVVADALKIDQDRLDPSKVPFEVIPRGSGSHGPMLLLQLMNDFGDGFVKGIGSAAAIALFNAFWKEYFLNAVRKASLGMLGKEKSTEESDPVVPKK